MHDVEAGETRITFVSSADVVAGRAPFYHFAFNIPGVIDFTSIAEHGVRVYKTGVTVRGAKSSTYQFNDYPYTVTLEERCACA